jgi:hypothetical protein
VLFYPFAQTLPTLAGQPVRVCGSHDRESLTIWAESGVPTEGVVNR